MANEIEKVLLRDSQDSKPEPTSPFLAQQQQQQKLDASSADLFGPGPSTDTEMVFGSGEYLRRGVRAGSEQVQGSFDGIAAIGNLLVGDQEAAERRLNQMQQHD